MAQTRAPKRSVPRRSNSILGSRIARLIFVSNLAGLAILILGAMFLNEMRAGFVASKKQDLEAQAQIFSSLLSDDATTPEPGLNAEAARQTLQRLNLPDRVRARIFTPQGELVGDSYYLSERVDVTALPPLRDPSWLTRTGRDLSEWTGEFFAFFSPRRSSESLRTQSFEEEFGVAAEGGQAASQRFSDRGQRVISVSMPVQRVSAVVGVLVLEASDIDEIIRAERVALVPFIGVAVLMAFITSLMLTVGIARPLRRLALAADRIRAGASDRIDVPLLTQRSDEIGDLASSMQGMTEALLERIEANEQFAADVAHELKNPLTSIRSAVETLERVKDPEAAQKLRQVIASDVKRLDRLITDISNASRLEAEMTRLPSEQIDIARFVRDVVRTYEGIGDDTHPVHVSFTDATMGARLIVRGREGPLGQVLRNLIDNARSFSPSGGTVEVRLDQTNEGPRTIARLIVEDSGPGIPADKLDTIFNRFYTDRPKGTAFGNNSGLGLSIVRQIIATHRGKVWAENRTEGGARFTVDLPAI
ncbi:MAG TPA: stimulus-sensing domain-containing protein [Hyphomonas sp.]|nr:histidine kinase [Hyphomonas sp.]HRJ02377.1 stimulus-sensing domain-containing protein [Hyphomonas sp.]HRK68912.1 stimulus-sensing domain-containing protein [Hyphomonas sp.]